MKAWRKDPDLQKLVRMADRRLGWVLKGDADKHLQAVANMFWAIGKLNRKLQPQLSLLRPKLFEAVQYTSYYMGPQEVANVIYACALLNLPVQELDPFIGCRYTHP